MKKTAIIALVLAGSIGLVQAKNNSDTDTHVQSATAISKVFGDGRKVTTMILEYDAPVSNSSLSVQTYQAEGKEIARVYANTVPETASEGTDGQYVIIEFKTAVDLSAQPMPPKEKEQMRPQGPRPEMGRGPGHDGPAPGQMGPAPRRMEKEGGPGLKAGWSTGGNDRYPGTVTVVQVKKIRTVGGTVYNASATPIETTAEKCLVADDFQQMEFRSPYTGQTLPYNLYIPEDYDPEEQYPLVLFIHDAGVASGPVTQTLYQGNGATSWAEPEAQARHKCIVLAPEYPVITVDDNWNYSHHLDATIALIKDLETRYSIDPDRIYTTGQSMGCMSSIVLMLKEPEMFAGALLVAGKWNPEVMVPLNRQNIWIISCEGDVSSNTLQGEAVALWRSEGSEVTEATWDMTLPAEELSAEAEKMIAEGNHLLFTHLTGGSHRATWFVAYGIPAVQDWLFAQHR